MTTTRLCVLLFAAGYFVSRGVPAPANPPEFALNDRVRSLRTYMGAQRVERCFPGFLSAIFRNQDEHARGLVNKKSGQMDVAQFGDLREGQPSWLRVPPMLRIKPASMPYPTYDLAAAYDRTHRVFAISYAENDFNVIAFVRDAEAPRVSLPVFDARRIRSSDRSVSAVPPAPSPDALGYGDEVKYVRACGLSRVVYEWGTEGVVQQAVYIYDGPTLIAFRMLFAA